MNKLHVYYNIRNLKDLTRVNVAKNHCYLMPSCKVCPYNNISASFCIRALINDYKKYTMIKEIDKL